jgi:hypothetical protein
VRAGLCMTHADMPGWPPGWPPPAAHFCTWLSPCRRPTRLCSHLSRFHRNPGCARGGACAGSRCAQRPRDVVRLARFPRDSRHRHRESLRKAARDTGPHPGALLLDCASVTCAAPNCCAAFRVLCGRLLLPRVLAQTVRPTAIDFGGGVDRDGFAACGGRAEAAAATEASAKTSAFRRGSIQRCRSAARKGIVRSLYAALRSWIGVQGRSRS